MQIRGIFGGLTSVLGVLASMEYAAKSLGSVISFAIACKESTSDPSQGNKSIQSRKNLTRTTIFAPSVVLPAPRVIRQSAFAARASFAISMICVQGV